MNRQWIVWIGSNLWTIVGNWQRCVMATEIKSTMMRVKSSTPDVSSKPKIDSLALKKKVISSSKHPPVSKTKSVTTTVTKSEVSSFSTKTKNYKHPKFFNCWIEFAWFEVRTFNLWVLNSAADLRWLLEIALTVNFRCCSAYCLGFKIHGCSNKYITWSRRTCIWSVLHVTLLIFFLKKMWYHKAFILHIVNFN